MANIVGVARSLNGRSCPGGIHGGHSTMTKKNRLQYSSSSSSSSPNNATTTTTRSQLTDQYKTLQLQPGASESDVKKSFRRLALQYHPDVCKGSNCGVQFHQINEAYDIVMSNLRGESTTSDLYDTTYNDIVPEDDDGPMRGMYDADWDLWEEWMGWEGAGIRDYSSHINPYI